jgi:hypothetical protein
MSDTLRSRAIRLAAALPEGDSMRREVLAAVKESARGGEPKWTNTVAGAKARIRWNTHPRHQILIEELPVKGKKRLRQAEYWGSNAFGSTIHMPDAFMIENLTRDMRPSPSMSFEQAVTAFQEAIQKAIKEVNAGSGRRGQGPDRPLADWERTQLERAPSISEVFYLEVEPADYSPLSVQGKDFTMAVEWGEFEAYSPNSDFQQMDPHYSVKKQKSAGAARKLFKILKADPDALRGVAWSVLGDWLAKNGVGYDSHSSQWH